MAESRDNPRWFKNHEGFRGLRVAVDLFGSIELIYYPWSFGVWGLCGVLVHYSPIKIINK